MSLISKTTNNYQTIYNAILKYSLKYLESPLKQAYQCLSWCLLCLCLKSRQEEDSEMQEGEPEAEDLSYEDADQGPTAATAIRLGRARM